MEQQESQVNQAEPIVGVIQIIHNEE
jgi:hypothetical protein